MILQTTLDDLSIVCHQHGRSANGSLKNFSTAFANPAFATSIPRDEQRKTPCRTTTGYGISTIKGIKKTRKVVVLAQMITAKASAAATSPAPAQSIAADVTLGYVLQMLAEVVKTLDVASLHLEKDLQSVPGASPTRLGKH